MSQSAYAKAGVDIEAGDRAVKLMSQSVKATHRPEVVGGIGGFAGLFDASAFKNYRRPLLATSTDGVGTKVAIAQALGKHDTIGWDLVGMLVDDEVVDQHADEVPADGVVLAQGLGDRHLRTDTVGRGRQQRPAVVLERGRIEQSGKAADAADHLGPVRRLDRLRHELD